MGERRLYQLDGGGLKRSLSSPHFRGCLFQVFAPRFSWSTSQAGAQKKGGLSFRFAVDGCSAAPAFLLGRGRSRFVRDEFRV